MRSERITLRGLAVALALPCLVACSVHSLPSAAPIVEIVQSLPSETTLEPLGLAQAKAVWPQMIRAARHSIDIAQYYVSSSAAADSALSPVLLSLEDALRRNVRVRLLVDAAMAETYPDDLARLVAHGALVRRIDLRPLTGGIAHAKFFVVDDREAFLGSQNFDWRSLEHIHEVGVRLRSPQLAQALSQLFASDWARAVGEPAALPRAASIDGWVSGAPLHARLAFSPLPLVDASAWDLPAMVELVAQARQSVRLEVLLYRGPQAGEVDTPMARIEAALLAAAARGVKVEILFSDWMLREKNTAGLRGLVGKPGINVKIVTIPKGSGGDIPFARLIHAKYLVVDGQRLWIGSTNFEDRYFLRSRNASVIIDSQPLGAQLDAIFSKLWQSPYARPWQ